MPDNSPRHPGLLRLWLAIMAADTGGYLSGWAHGRHGEQVPWWYDALLAAIFSGGALWASGLWRAWYDRVIPPLPRWRVWNEKAPHERQEVRAPDCATAMRTARDRFGWPLLDIGCAMVPEP